MFQPNPQGMPGGMGFGMITPPEQIIEAIVVDIGEAYQEIYSDSDEVNEHMTEYYKDLPYKVNDTVFFTGGRPAFDIEGFTYIRFDHVIAWRPDKSNNE